MSYMGMSQHIDFDSLPDPNTRFELLEIIGEGTYGEVYEAKDHETGDLVAVKVMENISENLEEIEEEYLVLNDLSIHPNLPSFYGIFLKKANKQEEDQAWLVIELCGRGSVTDLVQALLRRGQRLREHQIGYVLKETIYAMIYLHENHCMHRDIKGHNILMTNAGEVKLVDFGVSSHLASTWGRRNTSVGTPYWMAPEVIACEQQLDYSYDVRCDIWSLGITAIELSDGEPPLADIHPMRALFQIPRNPPPTVERPCEWTNEFLDFIGECLQKDFEQRPSARELLQHPFLKQVPNNTDEIRRDLLFLSDDLKKMNQTIQKQPEMTIKGGALKPDRKTKRTPLWMDDLACLEKLSEDIIVEHLKKRYDADTIYTYVGDILIAVNPFKELGIYGEKESHLYHGMVKSECQPHIFAMADSAYHTMMHQKQPQCIVISGESGAGKTESANLLLKQLVTLGNAPNPCLEEKILQVNPIMEAFGNAMTGINDNSSRFGKYLDLSFHRVGRVTGAKISVYLLEQTRVVYQAQGEQNFHIFYYVHDGLEAEDKLLQYCLDKTKREKHKYLMGSTWSRIKSQKNVRQFRKVVEGFKSLGFRDDELDSIYRILAAIINLGDIRFYQTIDKDNMEQAAVKNVEQIKIVSELLGVDPADLTETLTSNSVVTKGETITRNNTVDEAVTTRDSMAKAMYGRLFDWIVNNINRLLAFSQTDHRGEKAIGLLDIFGFENFVMNSFEQLCINIANEQIQYFFNQHIFTWEQQEYMAEGVEVDIIKFADNRPVLDMFLAKPMGLLALLDEESRFPKATDMSLVEKFHENLKSKYYLQPKGQCLDFAIRHFAGKVSYNAANFLEKNKNFLPTELIHLLRQSTQEIIQFLFQCPLTKTGNLSYATPRNSPSSSRLSKTSLTQYDSRGLASQTKAQQTVGTYFRYSLMDLLQKMVNGVPHFIRCIKPNDDKASNNFDSNKVGRQLKYAGVMETVRIRQHGFSHRIPFADFLRRYCFLAFNYDERVVASKANCRLLLLRLKMDGWALGKTKVFLKYYHVEYLTKTYEKQVQRIVKVQACVRRWLAKVRCEKDKFELAKSALTLQTHFRCYLARKQMQPLLSEMQQSKKEEDRIREEEERKAREKSEEQKQEIERTEREEKENQKASDDQDEDETETKSESPPDETGGANYGVAEKKAATLIQSHEDETETKSESPPDKTGGANYGVAEEKAATLIQSHEDETETKSESSPDETGGANYGVAEEKAATLIQSHEDETETKSESSPDETGGANYGVAEEKAATLIQSHEDETETKSESPPDETGGANYGVAEEKAATLIQSRYRGYKTRMEWCPVLEEHLTKLVEDHIDNPDAAQKALQEEGLSLEEAGGIIQKYWGDSKKKTPKEDPQETCHYTNSKKFKNLIMFSQNVHLANQGVHSHLHRQKGGINLELIKPAPDNYVRPRGFDDVPKLIHEQRKTGPHQQPLNSKNLKSSHLRSSASNYYDSLQFESQSPTPEFEAECSWDAPIASKFTANHNNSGTKQEMENAINKSKNKEAKHDNHIYSNDRTTPTTNMEAASDLRKMLRSTKAPVTKSHPEGEEQMGPYNFQQFLRKTNYAPTDTIRKRKEEKCSQNN